MFSLSKKILSASIIWGDHFRIFVSDIKYDSEMFTSSPLHNASPRSVAPYIIEADRIFFDNKDMLYLILIPEAS